LKQKSEILQVSRQNFLTVMEIWPSIIQGDYSQILKFQVGTKNMDISVPRQ
jgi:hypothetical protein